MLELSLAAALLAAPAVAAAPAQASVEVSLGAALQARAPLYGARELESLTGDLRSAVARRAAAGGFDRVVLVIEAAVPNRPTPAMLGRFNNFDLTSVSRGGAKISGTAFGRGGARPVRFSWWAQDLRDSAGSGVWTDADRAFQLLGAELAHGRTPDRFRDGDAPTDWPLDGSLPDTPGRRTSAVRP